MFSSQPEAKTSALFNLDDLQYLSNEQQREMFSELFTTLCNVNPIEFKDVKEEKTVIKLESVPDFEIAKYPTYGTFSYSYSRAICIILPRTFKNGEITISEDQHPDKHPDKRKVQITINPENCLKVFISFPDIKQVDNPYPRDHEGKILETIQIKIKETLSRFSSLAQLARKKIEPAKHAQDIIRPSA